jgi:hypothetical protein
MEEDSINPSDKQNEADQQGQNAEDTSPTISMYVSEKSSGVYDPTSYTNQNKWKGKPMSRYERWIVGLTLAAILVAASTGGAIIWQDIIASATLNQFRDEHRPWLGLKDDIHVEETPFTPDNAYVSWAITTSVWNYGVFPATRIITTIDTGKSIAFRIHSAWKNTEDCRNAAQLSRSSPDYYPNASGLFPATSLPFSDTLPVETGSNYLAICIAYTDATKRPYSTKLLYVRAQKGFRLLDADVQ